jgi:hypothetical protein
MRVQLRIRKELGKLTLIRSSLVCPSQSYDFG